VQRSQGKIVLLMLVLATATVSEAVGQNATVSGVVRDTQGVVQMGALVQVVASDSSMVRAAFTDLHGRYLITHLLPGKYNVEASAALFVPATRGNLELRSGARNIVNLTLNTLFEPSVWLPAERRRADEPDDDWKWTLRSAANRPLLRLVEDGNSMEVSSSVTESRKPVERIRGAVTAGDGGFGSNGVNNVITLNRVLDDGSNMILRADYGTTGRPYTAGPSMELASGYERELGFAGAARTVVTYQSHPEMVGSGGVSGLNVMQAASAQRMKLGDTVDLEVGSAVFVVRTSRYATAARPFLKIAVHPNSTWTVGYRMATSQNLQSFDGLDDVQQELPVAIMSHGKLQTERGLHQEFSVSRKAGRGEIQIAYYLDSLDHVVVAGGGSLSASDVEAMNESPTGGILADSTTGDFRALGGSYKTNGVDVTLTEPLTPSMWMALAYSTGEALTAKDGSPLTLPTLASDLTPQMAQSATLALKGRVIRSGTSLRVAYRWEPERLVTAVNPYAPFGDQAYLSCYLRQAIRLGNLLPPGLEATVDVTNLLAEGYRPILSADGHTLFLAQAPRTLQGGLAFTF